MRSLVSCAKSALEKPPRRLSPPPDFVKGAERWEAADIAEYAPRSLKVSLLGCTCVAATEANYEHKVWPGLGESVELADHCLIRRKAKYLCLWEVLFLCWLRCRQGEQGLSKNGQIFREHNWFGGGGGPLLCACIRLPENVKLGLDLSWQTRGGADVWIRRWGA